MVKSSSSLSGGGAGAIFVTRRDGWSEGVPDCAGDDAAAGGANAAGRSDVGAGDGAGVGGTMLEIGTVAAVALVPGDVWFGGDGSARAPSAWGCEIEPDEAGTGAVAGA